MQLIVVVILLIGVQPFKENFHHYTVINANFLLLIAMLYVCVVGLQSNAVKYIIEFTNFGLFAALLPLVYVSAIILHWMHHRRRFGWQLIRRICAWRHGYNKLM